MSITVHEVLELEICSTFKVVAGKSGITNKIKKIGILDHETGTLVDDTFSEGQFILTTLFVIKDNISELHELVNKMIILGVSALAIRNVYFKDIPEDVKELANYNAFPIIIYSDVYFEDVFVKIFNAMKEKEEREDLALKIDTILSDNIDKPMIRKIALLINSNFKEINFVTFVKNIENAKYPSLKLISNVENDSADNKIITYNSGYIIIHTFNKNDILDLKEFATRRLERWGFNTEKNIIGISRIYKNLYDISNSIKESLYAYNYALSYEKNISCFQELGVNRLLLPLINNPWVNDYYEEMIGKLINYDTKNDTEYLETAIIFVENNGNIKATAIDLNQHNNTIRYRIEKIYKLLSINEENLINYEDLAIVIRIYNLIK